MGKRYQFLPSAIKVMKKFIKGYFISLFNPQLAPTALKVALFIGTILLIINHGYALFRGQMTSDRWISVLLTYCMPYLVNIHGQYISNSRKK